MGEAAPAEEPASSKLVPFATRAWITIAAVFTSFPSRNRSGAALLFAVAVAAFPAQPAAAGGTYRYMSTYVFCQGGFSPSWGSDAYSDKPEMHLDLVLAGFDGNTWVTLDHSEHDKWTRIRGKFFVIEVRKGAKFGDRYKRYRVTGKLTRGNSWTSDMEEC